METVSISDIENVVRFISHLHKDGTINPKSFKLRQWPEPKGPERYISVNRYESASLVADLQAYDKGRNLVCALMNVGEIRKTSLFLGDTEEYPVKYDVRDMHSVTIPSHAGIFITIADMPLEGYGDAILDNIEEGKEKTAYLLAIRRVLVDIAAKSLVRVNSLCEKKAAETNQ